MDDDLEDRIDQLYELPLERFVAEREVLAKELRAAGRREEAAAVGALAKPSVAAWAVNQVVRSQPKAARALWAAGDEVLDVQERVMAGGGKGAELRAAVESERAALAPLADAARGLLTGSGSFLGDAHVQAVTETLHAAAVDLEARIEVAAGRASRPRRLTGLGAGAAAPATGGGGRGGTAAKTAGKGTSGSRTGPPAEPDPRAAADDAARRREDRARRARRTETERLLTRAERARDKAREAVADAVRTRDEAAARCEAAMRALAAAEDALGEADQALQEGHAALERAEAAVDAAREDVERA